MADERSPGWGSNAHILHSEGRQEDGSELVEVETYGQMERSLIVARGETSRRHKEMFPES